MVFSSLSKPKKNSKRKNVAYFELKKNGEEEKEIVQVMKNHHFMGLVAFDGERKKTAPAPKWIVAKP